jgi:hypothetical protein
LCDYFREESVLGKSAERHVARRGMPQLGTLFEFCRMSVLDLAKATIVCGGISYLSYNFPPISQAVMIGAMFLLWLLYAQRTIANLLRK